MSKPKASPLIFFFGLLAIIVIISLFGPEDATLGANVRIVYLHGAWVLTAEVALFAAAIAGLIGLIAHFIPALKQREDGFHHWSAALGRTGIVFWVTYLPLSLWAMQANWNGLFLSEPRFRLAVTFAVTGVLMQIGLTLLSRPIFNSLFNVLFFAALEISLRQADYVMHPPPSPIFGSGILSLELYFIGVLFLTMAAAYFLTHWWLQRQG
jgi:hypothetical protein